MNKKLLYGIIGFLLFAGIIGFNYYQKIFGNTIKEDTVLFVRTNESLLDIKEKLTPFSKSPQTFLWVSAKKNFSKPKPGRYLLKEGMSNNDIVNMLRIGNQTPIKIAFNNQDTVEKLAGRIAEQLETDSLSLLNAFTDTSFLSKNNLSKKAAIQIYIPNSYEVYWNTSAEKFRDKMLREYKRFWNSNRLEKANKLGLTKDQVITLASIVQKETAQKSERPIIAGLYLNRLKGGWPLQADPTIIYCVKEVKGQDFVVKRVLTKDLELKSPYNTYKNTGLPPTLIAMPDVSAIEAVLNPAKHKYMYMCASVDKIGFHEFAKTLSQHNRNAAKYQRWINQRGIGR